MNNGFYILPNEEGYLVKSHDTNSEIALFRSRRDAEVFISTLTLSPSISPVNNYSAVSAVPQYSTPPQQQVITPYPAASGSSPQVFFIQQPAPAQQSAPAPYPYYPPMPPMGMYPGMYHGMYSNWPQNNCGGGCTCGHGSYHDHSEEDYHRKDSTEKKYQGSKRKDDLRKSDDEDNNRQESDRSFNAENVVTEPLQTSSVQPITPVTAQEQYNEPPSVLTNESPLGQQGFGGSAPAPQTFVQQEPSAEQQLDQNQTGTGVPDYYEQAFVANPVYVNQEPSQPQSQAKTTTKPIGLSDDDFFSFINDEDFNHNPEMSKKETKRLAKEELKAAKLQAKLEKQNRKKSNRENVNDIEDLSPIVK